MQNNTAKQKSKTPPATARSCPICGKEFVTNLNRIYCSVECRRAADKRRRTEGGKDRELTGFSVYLIHKYSIEGMSVNDIAELLNRSPENVRRGLKMPLSKEELWALQHYAKNRRRKPSC